MKERKKERERENVEYGISNWNFGNARSKYIQKYFYIYIGINKFQKISIYDLKASHQPSNILIAIDV